MLQFALNGLIAGSVVALTAVSFVIVYRTAGFFNFAHAGVIATGPYTFLFLRAQGVPPLWAVLLFWVAPTMLGGLLEKAVHQPLRSRQAKSAGLLLASLGTYTLVQNILALGFGDETRSFRWWQIQEGWKIGIFRLTATQATIVAVAWLFIGLTWTFLRNSDLGKSIRAVAVSPSLAEIVGLDVGQTRIAATFLGSALAGISGFLIACDVDMSPTMGVQPLMTAVVAVLLSRSHLVGAGIAAIALTVLQNVILYWLPSGWQDVFIFSVLLLFFLFRSRIMDRQEV